jgi:hypothetical protein
MHREIVNYKMNYKMLHVIRLQDIIRYIIIIFFINPLYNFSMLKTNNRNQ